MGIRDTRHYAIVYTNLASDVSRVAQLFLRHFGLGKLTRINSWRQQFAVGNGENCCGDSCTACKGYIFEDNCIT